VLPGIRRERNETSPLCYSSHGRPLQTSCFRQRNTKKVLQKLLETLESPLIKWKNQSTVAPIAPVRMMKRVNNHAAAVCIALKRLPLRGRDRRIRPTTLCVRASRERSVIVCNHKQSVEVDPKTTSRLLCVLTDHSLGHFVFAAAPSRRFIDPP